MNLIKHAWIFFVCCLLAAVSIHAAHAESLYRESTYRALTSDNKAYQVGDVLTVQIFETSSATTTTDTDTRRNNTISAELDHGSAKTVGQLGLSTAGTFDGGGTTERSNKVLTTISVTVREVLPNGDLRVAGNQMLTINKELQKVSVEGRVRPADISPGNVVVSTHLADAKITYDGQGDLSERNRRPWWRQLLDFMGL